MLQNRLVHWSHTRLVASISNHGSNYHMVGNIMRNTGQTTRNLVGMLNAMLHDESTPYYVVITNAGTHEAIRQANTFNELLRDLGIDSKMISESACKYTVKWNGEAVYVRHIYFTNKEREMEVYALKGLNAKNSKTYYDITYTEPKSCL